MSTTFEEVLRTIIREEIQAASGNGHKGNDLLTAEELSEKLKVPVSWVYDASRQKKIPTHK